MSDQSTHMTARDSVDPRVIIVDGNGVALTVSRGHVVIKDGNGNNRRERILSRIDAKTSDGISRIMILAETGYISLEIIRWAWRLGIAICQIERDGNIILHSPGQGTDARLYKQQILASPGMPDAAIGTELFRQLITAKLAGQAETLRFMNQSPDKIMRYSGALPQADMRRLLTIEGNAAQTYWDSWKNCVFVPSSPQAIKYWPAHWHAFNGRASQTRGGGYTEASNRNATDVVNAMLNYAYKIAETEAVHACHIMGLHPGIGVAHGEINADKPAMALDILEPLRPIADRVVLSFLDCGRGIPIVNGCPAYISHKCVYETGTGICRLYPPLTHGLAARVSMAVAFTALQWAQEIARKLAVNQHLKLTAPLDVRMRPRTEQAHLVDDITVQDLIPDHIWERIQPLIPERQRRSGPHRDTRTILAALVAREIYNIPWSRVTSVLGIHYRTCTNRLTEWQDAGMWEKIKLEITKPGISLAV